MAPFTVFFEGPFWVGVLEVEDEDGLRAWRHVFGPEPSGPEVLAFLLTQWRALRGRPAVAVATPKARSPKRAARDMARARRAGTPSRKAQEALAAAREQGALEARQARRRLREAHARHVRAVREAKARARRRGH